MYDERVPSTVLDEPKVVLGRPVVNVVHGESWLFISIRLLLEHLGDVANLP